MKPPRSIFRSRRRNALVVSDRPEAGYIRQAIEAGLKLTPGTISVAEIRHDADCRRPQGGPCSCTPEIRMRPLDDPERN